MDAASMSNNSISFHRNSVPATQRSVLSRMTRGIPPSRVPTGQIYLQKYGGVPPMED